MPLGGMPEDLSDPGDIESFNEEVRLLYVGMTATATAGAHQAPAKVRQALGKNQAVEAKRLLMCLLQQLLTERLLADSK